MSHSELAMILLVRIGCLWLLVLLSFLMPKAEPVYFQALMGIAFTLVVPYSLWIRNRLKNTQRLRLPFYTDLLLASGLIYFTGGPHSDLILIYPLLILSAGIILPPRQTVGLTGTGIGLYLLMALLFSSDQLTSFLPSGQHHFNPIRYTSILHISLLLFFGALSIQISKHFSVANEKSMKPDTSPTQLWDTLPCPIILLDANEHILFANTAACTMLNQENQQLCNHPIPTCVAEQNQPVIPEEYGPAIWIKRNNLEKIPVSIHTIDPEADIPLEGIKKIIILTDLSKTLEIESQLRCFDRITSATELAGEMAHEVRTPLTALSASVQLLKHYEAKDSKHNKCPNAPQRRDREELFEYIDDATHQLDTIIQHFLDFAEFSPEDLLSIIKLDSTAKNQSYIGHLNTVGKGIKNGQNPDSGRRSDNSQLVEQDTTLQRVRGKTR